MRKQGEEADIVAKMNSLCDPEIIAALYYASSCGVRSIFWSVVSAV